MCEQRFDMEKYFQTPYQERRAAVSIALSALLYLGYWLYVVFQAPAAGVNLAEDLAFWAGAILLTIGALVAANILLEIGLHILHAAVTREEKEPLLSDERDDRIEWKASRISTAVAGVGFAVAMALLALHLPAVWMINALWLSIFLGDIASNAGKLAYYRRGA